ncbi:hypothetical protein N0V88_001364 [Collariella sp. IMI 366227]|nr:hypothetical protein N0V88_001364 [Collariella sp. IMI 366227]
MKFFRRKDKHSKTERDNGGMPGFGSNSSNSKYSAAPGPAGPRTSDNNNNTSYRPFGGASLGAFDDPRNYNAHSSSAGFNFLSRPSYRSAALLAQLPRPVLARIFGFVCPHATDETYATCEQSAVDDGCMLCDLRDLARIRIDTVHYCDVEAVLAERRKRRSFFDRNGEPEDPAQARLKLLCRTLRDDPTRRGALVQFLKMPYMLRESCQADLARTIAVTPNLRYVDLPEGLFTDEPAFVTLRLEVQARCLELRKMTYMGGSENSLQALASGRELIRIEMEPSILRQALGYLGNLRALKISDATSFTDDTLAWNDMLPPFPPLEEFILTNLPNITAAGLKSWLVLPEAQHSLRVLTLNSTGPRIPPLRNHRRLPNPTSNPLPNTSTTTTASYYTYLATSLLAGTLPNLSAVYVRDPTFPDLLLHGLPPPTTFAGGGSSRPASSSGNLAPNQFGQNPRFSSNNPFATSSLTVPGFGGGGGGTFMNLPTKLEVFTKGDDDQMGWDFVQVAAARRQQEQLAVLTGR